MNLAIVDDIASECKTLRGLLEQYESKQKHPITIKEFYTGKELLYGYIPGNYDVIFLDIFLSSENGVDCAREIRQLDTKVNIIFLTSSEAFAIKSYDVRAADYIVKPITLEKLSRALHYCEIDGLQNKSFITVTTKNHSLDIALDHIFYADFQDRSACIHIKDRNISVSSSFTALSRQLEPYSQFMTCFKGIVVNLKHVEKICDNFLILKNKERLPVSRRLQKQVAHKRLSLSAGSLRGD